MEVETAIILALSEPLFRNKLLTKTNEILREFNQKPTHKTEFNEVLKKLVSDGWIIRNPQNKDSKVFYELDNSKKVTAKKFFQDYEKYHEKKILSIIESLRVMGEEIIDKHKNKKEISSHDKNRYQAMTLLALLILLDYQKYFFFLKNVAIDSPSTKSSFARKIQNIEKTLLFVLKPIANVLGNESLLVIYGTILKSMESEIERREKILKAIQEIHQKNN